MTGYGKAEVNILNKNFFVEIKSLNSKNFDLNIKMSSIYRGEEISLRKLILEKLKRGKIELSIWCDDSNHSNNYKIDKEIVSSYLQQIKDLNIALNKNNTDFKNINTSNDLLQVIANLPGVIIKNESLNNKSEWKKINEAINEAIDSLIKFRINEGKVLGNDIFKRITIISKLLKQISTLSKTRIVKTKKNLKKKLIDLQLESINENRLEQELIYWLEKLDITEEQVRLSSHLDYFIKTLNLKQPKGKKLSFITQEIGREINTIGAKASNAKIQKIVIQMKDELEKIKEQILNVL